MLESSLMTRVEAGQSEVIDSSLLVKQAESDALEFFGRRVDIPQPPNPLLETLLKLQSLGLGDSQGIYFPNASLGRGDNYPGWRVKIGEKYYDWLEAGQIAKAAPALTGNWAIVDMTEKPDYSVIKSWRESGRKHEGPGYYHDNEISRIIDLARAEGDIATRDHWGEILPYLPRSSRLGVSPDQQDDIVFPGLAKALGLDLAQVAIRRPTLAELNNLGNLGRFTHQIETNLSETVQDVYSGIIDINKPGHFGFPPRAIITGNSKYGGVGQVNSMLTRDQVESVTFRFVISFN